MVRRRSGEKHRRSRSHGGETISTRSYPQVWLTLAETNTTLSTSAKLLPVSALCDGHRGTMYQLVSLLESFCT